MFHIQDIRMILQRLKMKSLLKMVMTALIILIVMTVRNFIYIIHAKKGEKQQYAVFDEKKKFIKSYSGDVVNQQECIDAFKEKYKQTPDDVEIGYENEIFVYSLLYRGEDSLIYAFYGVDSGEFIKAYRIDNSSR